MRKANMQLLRKFGKVIIPEIVYDEVRNKHRERLEGALVAINRKIDEYNDLGPEKAKNRWCQKLRRGNEKLR